MKPIWVLEVDIFDEENPYGMAELIQKAGMEVRWIQYMPFHGGLKHVTITQSHIDKLMHKFKELPMSGLPDGSTPVIFYGGLNAADYITKNLPWKYGIWCDQSILRCQDYYPAYGKELLQEKYVFMPLKEVRRHKEWLFSILGIDGTVFIRPDRNDKLLSGFTGELLAIEKFDEWEENLQKRFAGNELVVIANPLAGIGDEYRVVVSCGRFISASRYRHGGMTDYEKGCPDFVQRYTECLLSDVSYSPHPIFVIDVAVKVGTRECKVVEVGSVNTCGLYDCELEPIVTEMTKLASDAWSRKHEPGRQIIPSIVAGQYVSDRAGQEKV